MTWFRCLDINGGGNLSVVSLIPKMTSNTTPSGVASASTEYTSAYAAYKTMDNSISTLWGTANAHPSGQWIKYDFGQDTRVCALSYVNRNSQNNAVGEFVFQGSNDDDSWTDIKTITNLAVDEIGFVPLDNPVSFRYYRWYIVSNVPGSSNNGTGFVELQLYADS